MKKEKRFIIRKYVMATSAQNAIKKDKITPVDDVWIDEKWKELNDNIQQQIGF